MSKTEEKLNESFSCHVFNLGQRIGVMIGADYIEKNILIQRFEEVKNWVNDNMGLSLLIGVGSVCGSIGKISLSYRSALDALEYSVVLGKNMVIDADRIAETTKEKIAIDDFDSILKTNEDHLVIAVRNSDKKKVREILEEIIHSVNQIVRNDIKQKERVIFLLAFYLTKILFSLEIPDHKYYGSENDLFVDMNSMTEMNDIKELMYGFMDDAIKELHKTQKSKNSYLVNRALRIIDTNPESKISLVSVAERLQINPSYLSRIFSEETGESFSEHLIKNKMESAKQMLKTTNKKVYEIADSLGYRDVGHFTKIFKKHFGVSPTEYRNLM
jgi:two-component system response regulator YesN